MFKRKVRLPISVEEYDALVSRLCTKYAFKEKDYVAAVISVAIRHIDNQTSYTTLEYLAGCIWKHMANSVASHKSDLIKHTVKVDAMISMFKQDPNNQQVLDELRKYADGGFEYAKTELAKLEATGTMPEAVCNVTPINSPAGPNAPMPA